MDDSRSCSSRTVRSELKVEGAKISGRISQAYGINAGPVDIVDVKLAGDTLTFKASSPDGERTVSFTGVVAGDSMTLTRDVKINPGGSPGFGGLLAVDGPSRFAMQRAK